MPWTRLTRRLFAKLGYRISRVENGMGGDPFLDMAGIVSEPAPIVFDVGANIGQTVPKFRAFFPRATIHSFEPSPTTFQTLKSNVSHLSNVKIWNCALGSASGDLALLENKLPEWSSLLPLGDHGWGAVEKETQVKVDTIDEFCGENGITKIDILKSDTQGYDYEVFKGAEQMFRKEAVGIVFCEIIFLDLYKNVPSFGKLWDFLMDRDFRLVSFYDLAYDNGLAAWTDGVFVHKRYTQR